MKSHKNFKLDKKPVNQVKNIAQEQKSKQKSSKFIGMLDGVIGDIDYKKMRKDS